MANNSNPMEIAQSQFDEAASFLGLDPALSEFLRWPMREFRFTIPVKMDDGRTKTFQGYRIRYNHARGPTIGGIRWHPDENLNLGRAMAAWMTWRTALADLPLGGAGGGVIADSKKLSDGEKERLARGWMRAMAGELGEKHDIAAPDVYTTPQVMAWMMDEYEAITRRAHPGVATDKPLALGGSRGRNDATARGGVLLAREACKAFGLGPKETTFAVQGFGNAGQFAALLHSEILDGGKLVAVSDTSGGVHKASGLDPKSLIEHKMKTGKIAGFPNANPISNEDLLELEVDVLYPAAMENVITERNADRIKAKILCELADGPTTPEADKILHVKGVHVIPDILANAGGVIAGYFELVQGTYNYYWALEGIHEQLDRKMTDAYRAVHKMHKDQKLPTRLAAYVVAVSRVAEAVKLRGWV
jgi:glutamate dehydrogenase (NAD(P)+)